MIEAVGLTKRYGPVTVVDQVTFNVAAGEVVGLLGPNGAGKTTILRMLAGILTPSAGTARVCGHDALNEAFAVKQRLGFLSGDTALYQRLTPREVLRYFGRLNELDPVTIDERSRKLFAELRMVDFADRRCGELSSGQRQKTNIARAFLHDPPALILDEPTATLDIVTSRFLLDAIGRARTSGKAVLFSTHVMGEAEYICDRVLFLYGGRIVESGSIEDVCARAHRKTLAESFLARIETDETLP